ncbi:MAG: hypothetical protein WA958_20240 [Tunicatimonas sp.]
MKQLLMISGLMLGTFSSFAQETVRTEEYCEFTVITGPLGSKGKYAIRLDQGRSPVPWLREVARLRDEQGDLILFNSAVDALNYLNGYGWTLVDVRGDECPYYLMRRTVRNREGSAPNPGATGYRSEASGNTELRSTASYQ